MTNWYRFTLTSLLCIVLTSCEPTNSRRVLASVSQNTTNQNNPSSSDEGKGAAPTDGSFSDNEDIINAKVETRHLVEPKLNNQDRGGTYTRKLTIPKNYNGLLYIAGINVSTLSDRNIKVRFKFGINRSPIVLDATVSTAEGLTPQTGIEVLVMDLRNRPFRDIQLIYDLYDYGNYDFTDPEVKEKGPAQYNREGSLYCRGLKLSDDPTFKGSLATGCVGPSDICRYAYAKVIDQSFVEEFLLGSGSLIDVPLSPLYSAIASHPTDYYNADKGDLIRRCSPDLRSTDPALSSFYFYRNPLDPSQDSLLLPGPHIVNGRTYYWKGAFQSLNEQSWQIGGDALTSNAGLGQIESLGGKDVYWRTNLFPLYSKMELTKDTLYYGFDDLETPTYNLRPMLQTGESDWMPGCNMRAATLNEVTGEHVGSCNVTATIEVISVDNQGVETVVDITDEVKLQLVKPEALNSSLENVLASSFRACESTSQCGSGECCINRRCWDKSLVSQCVEDQVGFGNSLPGESCISDHECSTLCCNQSTGRCAIHDTLSDPPIFCSKAPGQSCVAKEFCMKQPVTKCYIVRTGFDSLGGQTCALRCYTYEEHGDCRSSIGSTRGICVAPAQPEQPVFNPSDPARCADAIDPSEVDILNLVESN